MVTAIDELQQQNVTNHYNHKGMVVELVGVAGVGKTTLFEALTKIEYPWLSCEYVPPVWGISATPFYIKNTLSLIPNLVRMSVNNDRLLKRREIAYMAILYGWHELLRKEIESANRVVVLDEGPISLIADLIILGPRGLRNSIMDRWWDKIYQRWMQALDMVIWMDTSDEIIISRINNRHQDHFLKGESKQVALDWANKYRSIYREIIWRFTSINQMLRIVSIDSGSSSVDEIVDNILQEFSISM
jgi:shikimate kinase